MWFGTWRVPDEDLPGQSSIPLHHPGPRQRQYPFHRKREESKRGRFFPNLFSKKKINKIQREISTLSPSPRTTPRAPSPSSVRLPCLRTRTGTTGSSLSGWLRKRIRRKSERILLDIL
jgi:hypothetical protein